MTGLKGLFVTSFVIKIATVALKNHLLYQIFFFFLTALIAQLLSYLQIIE